MSATATQTRKHGHVTVSTSPIAQGRKAFIAYTANLAKKGTVAEIVSYVNSISSDRLVMEVLLGKKLTAKQSTALLDGSQVTARVYGLKFGKAHARTELLRESRATIRKACKEANLVKARVSVDTIRLSMIELDSEDDDAE